MAITDNQFVARLCLEARAAVIEHRRHHAEHPDQHRGCLWCEDGRLSYWEDDMRSFYRNDEDIIDRAVALYRRAYPKGMDLACEVSDGPRRKLP